MAGRGHTQSTVWTGVSIFDGLGVSIIDKESTCEIFRWDTVPDPTRAALSRGAVEHVANADCVGLPGRGGAGMRPGPMSRVSRVASSDAEGSGFLKPLAP